MDTEHTEIAAETNDRATLKKFLSRHPIVTFLLMGCCFLIMGIISLNLVYMFHANFEFILEYGVMGLRDGGFVQFIELVVSGYMALAFYVIFKTCEKALVEWLKERKMRKSAKHSVHSVPDQSG